VGKALPITTGTDGVILAAGTMVKDAVQVVEELKQREKSFALYSVPSICPMDDSLIQELSERFSVIYTIEEHSIRGGLADAVQRSLQKQKCVETQVYRMGFPDMFAPVTGSREYLNGLYGLDVMGIMNQILENESLVKESVKHEM
jgi:transketolase